ncbi:hypothetical protein HaLaN_06293 [Haematococcus lacustris]|uniref:Uncharacterized protein n=1 Tax=Haematococcus lacustris TaxID=44745 RepID=A0A699YLC6_HAELA|nr:hypothetical protein HaLaN_06293 [Haematococcus lacustris]
MERDTKPGQALAAISSSSSSSSVPGHQTSGGGQGSTPIVHFSGLSLMLLDQLPHSPPPTPRLWDPSGPSGDPVHPLSCRDQGVGGLRCPVPWRHCAAAPTQDGQDSRSRQPHRAPRHPPPPLPLSGFGTLCHALVHKPGRIRARH